MSKNTDMQTFVPSNENKPLNTTLHIALGSLDVQLEEELTRYRRHRRCEQLNNSQRKLERSATGEPDLIYVTATGGRTQPQPIIASPPETPIITLPEEKSIENLQPNEPKPQSLPTTTSPSLLLNGAETAPAETAESNTSGEKNPEGYLESSEALIESLKPEEEAPKQTETNSDDSLLSPLGIGSMLLFLMASIIFGYVATNPAGLAHLGLGRFFNRQAPSATQKPASENITETQIATSPNLASEEFVELNLSTLSNLNPKASSIAQTEMAQIPTPAASPLPTVTIAPAPGVKSSSGNTSGLKNLTSALLPQTNQSTKVSSSASKLPQPPVPAQSAKEAPTITATISLPINPAATPTPAKKTNTNAIENFYYVVMEYESEQSLEKARQVVADAYTREFPVGVRIQLGAFGDATTAQVLVQELQRQGLPAQVYRP